MKPNHVVIVIPGFPVDHDEPGLPAIVDLIQRISAVHDVEIVALRHPTNRGAYELAGARVHPLGLGNKGGPRARGRVLARGIRAVATLHRRRPVDLVHGMWADEAGAVATLAARWISRPSIVSVMGGEFVAMSEIGYGAALGRGGRSTARVSLRAADLITVPSSLIDDMVRPLVRNPEERLAFLPLGVDTETFRPAEHPGSTPTIVFAGSLAPVKDPETALRAFAAVAASHESVRLVVAGFGGMRGNLEAQARQLGIEDRVRF
ncbi:MAG TPA: glycosyltransferase, partial [Candidatus Limnocylindrales bacterium]|nr:glycosyltransferase [Candidatus Limnocylindrales bacterium]